MFIRGFDWFLLWLINIKWEKALFKESSLEDKVFFDKIY